MNNYLACMKAADMNIYEISKVVDVDVLEVAMAVHGVGLTYFDVAVSIAQCLGCSLPDLYPSITGNLEAFDDDGLSIDEMRELMLSREHAIPLMEAGLDPDLERWYAIVELKSGIEMRYRMSSAEFLKLQMALEVSEDSQGFFVFQADCRIVLLRKSALSEISFKNSASYAPFSTDEKGDRITIVLSDYPRPIEIVTPPDEEESRNLKDIVEAAKENQPLPPFIRMDEEQATKYVNIDNMQLMEIPLGLIRPELYELPSVGDDNSPINDLAEMVPLGSA